MTKRKKIDLKTRLCNNDIEAISELLHVLRDKFGKKLIDVWIHGSKARGDDSPDSDIDIVVFIKQDPTIGLVNLFEPLISKITPAALDPRRPLGILYKIVPPICFQYGVKLAVYPLSQVELKDIKDPNYSFPDYEVSFIGASFRQALRKEGISIFDWE